MAQKEKGNNVQSVWKNSVSVHCPNCQTLWHCYGMRKRSFYKCVICNHSFPLPKMLLLGLGVSEKKVGRRHPTSGTSEYLRAA